MIECVLYNLVNVCLACFRGSQSTCVNLLGLIDFDMWLLSMVRHLRWDSSSVVTLLVKDLGLG